jgi:hypothetical protein
VATDIKFVFVATGHNGDEHNRDSSFTVLATRHANFIVGQLNAQKGKAGSPLTLPAVVRFVHFDWQNDRILVYEHPFPEKGSKKPRPVWQALSAFVASAGTAPFDPKSFITKSATLAPNAVGISIVDVYRAVRKAPRGTVLDVSVYSHGFVDGPVLESTGDSQLKAASGQPIRTASDLDGRGRSDFTPHMGESNVAANKDALKEFREGFAPNATFRIFGCHVQDIVDGTAFGESSRSLLRSTVFEVIRAAFVVQLAKNTAAAKDLRKKKKPAAVTLDMGFELDLEDERNNTSPHLTDFTKTELKFLHYALDTAFFPDKNTGALTFDKPFTEVIKFIARQTKLGYVFKAAEALPAVTCLGAVPGSGGDFETGGNRLMFVPRKDWGLILLFFKNFMGLTMDERNYGRFDAAGVAAIVDRERNG